MTLARRLVWWAWSADGLRFRRCSEGAHGSSLTAMAFSARSSGHQNFTLTQFDHHQVDVLGDMLFETQGKIVRACPCERPVISLPNGSRQWPDVRPLTRRTQGTVHITVHPPIPARLAVRRSRLLREQPVQMLKDEPMQHPWLVRVVVRPHTVTE